VSDGRDAGVQHCWSGIQGLSGQVDGPCCTVPCTQHPQRFLAAFPRSPSQLPLLAQKDLWRGFEASLVGALSLLPVALLALARPLAVRPAPLLTGSFSPRPTDRFGNFFLGMVTYAKVLVPALSIINAILRGERLGKLGILRCVHLSNSRIS